MPDDESEESTSGILFSGERTRLACWFRWLAETNFKSAKANRFCPHASSFIFQFAIHVRRQAANDHRA
jgi:hypothetical protein